MATKLEELEVTSVDFVDRGANPDAHITLFKRDASDPAPVASKSEEQPKQSVWKRFLTAIGKWAGVSQDDIDAVAEEIEKADAEPADDTASETGNPAPAENVPAETHEITKNEPKGENEPMVDVSKMTPSEKLFYEDIVKRYSMEETPAEATDPVTKADNDEDEDDMEKCGGKTKKSAETAPADVAKSAEEHEDIYKGLHPLVAEELKRLRKRADDEDAKALTEVAKRYEIIGKKPEELVPVLKALKAAGGSAYDDMISVLDASVEAVNKSGVFSEIGKSGSYGSGEETAAWAKIEKKADEIQAANPNMGRYQAIDMACMQNPSLVHDYENGR